jgi:hypothetical protein
MRAMDAAEVALAALVDIFATPGIFLISYNSVAPRMFGFGRINYWDAFVFMFGARAVWAPPTILEVVARLRTMRIIAAVNGERRLP